MESNESTWRGGHAARRRAWTALAMVIAGVAVASRLGPPWDTPGMWFALAGLMGSGAIAAVGRWRSLGLALCVLCLSAGWTLLRTSTAGADRLDAVVGAIDPTLGRVPIEVVGVVTEPTATRKRVRGLADPPMWPETSTQARVRVDRVYVHESDGRGTWAEASGSLRVLVPDAVGLEAGQRVRVVGMYGPPGKRRNVGDPDWSKMAGVSGRVGTLVVGDARQVEIVAHDGLVDRLDAWLLAMRAEIRRRALIAVGLDHDGGAVEGRDAMLAALLLGERDPGFEGVYESFQRVGAAHVLAISGFHLALVILMAAGLVRVFGDHPRIEAAVLVGILLLVWLVIPLRPPIVRAGVIVAAVLLSGAAGRRYDRLTVLAWVGVGLLIWRPLDALGLGYQLSMGVTALLVMLGDRGRLTLVERQRAAVGGADKPRTIGGKALAWTGEAFTTNFKCWLVAGPAIAYHAGVVSLLAPLVVVVLLPLVAGLMAGGYVQVGLGVVWPGIAEHTGGVAGWLGEVTLGLVSWVDGLAGSSVRVPRISAAWAVAATAVAAGVVTRRLPARSWVTWGAVLLVMGWAVVEPTLWRERAPVRVDMVDVGDGSCVLVQSGGEGLLWDCGSLDRRVGRRTGDIARALGVHRIRQAVVTHDNLDHFNGLVEAGPRVGLERVWITERLADDGSPAWRRVSAALEEQGVTIGLIARGDRLVVGDAVLTVLWPDPALMRAMDDNDTSIVARVTVAGDKDGEPSVLLTGDIEGPAMEAIAVLEPGLSAEVIELPHHGSARRRAYGWVEAVDPAVVLQSTGPSRLDDERWDGVRPGRAWYTTAQRGGAWVRLWPDGRVEHGWAVGD